MACVQVNHPSTPLHCNCYDIGHNEEIGSIHSNEGTQQVDGGLGPHLPLGTAAKTPNDESFRGTCAAFDQHDLVMTVAHEGVTTLPPMTQVIDTAAPFDADILDPGSAMLWQLMSQKMDNMAAQLT